MGLSPLSPLNSRALGTGKAYINGHPDTVDSPCWHKQLEHELSQPSTASNKSLERTSGLLRPAAAQLPWRSGSSKEDVASHGSHAIWGSHLSRICLFETIDEKPSLSLCTPASCSSESAASLSLLFSWHPDSKFPSEVLSFESFWATSQPG